MILQSATVTRIERVKATAIPPAVAEVRMSDGETFPVFDCVTREAVQTAMESQSLVLLHLDESQLPPYHNYVRTITTINPDASSLPCPWCGSTMAREYGAVPRFACLNCTHRIYLERLPAAPCEALPTIARARLDVTTDGLFALDHMHHTATLMDTCASTAERHHPNCGVAAALSPFADRTMPDSWLVGSAYQRWLGENVTLTLADGRVFQVV